MAGVLFEDIFNVKDIDPEGKKFDRGEFYAGTNVRLCLYIFQIYYHLSYHSPNISYHNLILWWFQR